MKRICELTDVDLCKIISCAVHGSMRLNSGQLAKGTPVNWIRFDEEIREAMLEIMARVNCRNIDFGSYKCYEETKYGFSVDGCLVGEINHLNNNGINTVGCCCGHGKAQGYIQTSPEFVQAMLAAGYEQLPLDKYSNGLWCFRPKTPLPYGSKDLGLLGEIVKECNDVATPIDVALRKRIAELEGKIDQLTAHSDIERQDDNYSNHTQTQTIVYQKECEK